MTRLLVCGDRLWPEDSRRYLEAILDAYHQAFGVSVLIEGEAAGADRMARDWARARGIPVEAYPAHWRHSSSCAPECRQAIGKPAGVIRNRRMLREGRPDDVLAFHRHPETSRGSADMVTIARAAGIPATWVPFEGVRPSWSPLP